MNIYVYKCFQNTKLLLLKYYTVLSFILNLIVILQRTYIVVVNRSSRIDIVVYTEFISDSIMAFILTDEEILNMINNGDFLISDEDFDLNSGIESLGEGYSGDDDYDQNNTAEQNIVTGFWLRLCAH